MRARAAEDPGNRPGASAGNEVLWIAGGLFALLLAAWAALFIIAHRHPVETVPVTPPAARK